MNCINFFQKNKIIFSYITVSDILLCYNTANKAGGNEYDCKWPSISNPQFLVEISKSIYTRTIFGVSCVVHDCFQRYSVLVLLFPDYYKARDRRWRVSYGRLPARYEIPHRTASRPTWKNICHLDGWGLDLNARDSQNIQETVLTSIRADLIYNWIPIIRYVTYTDGDERSSQSVRAPWQT